MIRRAMSVDEVRAWGALDDHQIYRGRGAHSGSINRHAESGPIPSLQELHQMLSAGLVRLEDLHRNHLTQQEDMIRQWCTSRHFKEEAVPSRRATKEPVQCVKSTPANEVADPIDWTAPGVVASQVRPASNTSSTKLQTGPYAQWSGNLMSSAVVPAPYCAEQDHGRTQGKVLASSTSSSKADPNCGPPEDGNAHCKRGSPSPVDDKVQSHSSQVQLSRKDQSGPYRETLKLLEQVLAWLDKEEESTTLNARSSSWRDRFTWVANHYTFRTLVSLMIILNSITIGLNMHFLMVEQVKSPGRKVSGTGWVAVENVFCVFFMVELGVRAASESMSFVRGPNWKWNMFDLCLVSLCASDFILESAPNIGYARMLRLVRLARILRIIRVVRLFHSLRVMILSIVHSAQDLLWVFLLLFLVIYSFGIIFLTGVMEHLENNPSPNMDVVDKFLDLPKALLVLFMAISGGVDWQDVILPLFQMGTFYGITFFIYIFFVTFGVLNVVTSMFVDSAFQVSQRDRETVVQGQLSRDLEYRKKIKEFFFQADTDDSGSLSWEEFDTYLSDPKVQAYFSSLELDVTQARALFKLMDLDETNDVGINEFVDGCMKLRGVAKSIDVNMLLYENEQMISKWTAFMQKTEQALVHLQKALGVEVEYLVRKSESKSQSRLSNALRVLDQHGQ